jgi:hypothetical protein
VAASAWGLAPINITCKLKGGFEMATAQVVSIIEYNGFPGVKKIVWTWLATDQGIVTGSKTTNKYTGEVTRFITDPGATAPTAAYDITILDDDGVDVLIGAGADRSATLTEQVIASSLGYIYDSKLTLEILHAGDSKIGVVYLYIKDTSGRRI